MLACSPPTSTGDCKQQQAACLKETLQGSAVHGGSPARGALPAPVLMPG